MAGILLIDTCKNFFITIQLVSFEMYHICVFYDVDQVFMGETGKRPNSMN